MARSRAWVFTLYQERDEIELEEFSDTVRAAVWQREIGDEKHHEHLQGYIEFTKAVRFSRVKEILGRNVHIEPRRGTQRQAIDYSTKEQGRVRGPWWWPNKEAFAQQGRRSDLERVAATVLQAESIRDVVDEHPVEFLRMARGIQDLFTLSHDPPRRDKPNLIVMWGDSGTGKSKTMYDIIGDQKYYVMDDTPQAWMDGYWGQSLIVIDDFECRIPRGQFLRLIDWHPLRMQRKGGYVIINANQFIITSNTDPREWYGQDPAVRRRLRDFGTIYFFPREGDYEKQWDCDTPQDYSWP